MYLADEDGGPNYDQDDDHEGGYDHSDGIVLSRRAGVGDVRDLAQELRFWQTFRCWFWKVRGTRHRGSSVATRRLVKG